MKCSSRFLSLVFMLKRSRCYCVTRCGICSDASLKQTNRPAQFHFRGKLANLSQFLWAAEISRGEKPVDIAGCIIQRVARNGK